MKLLGREHKTVCCLYENIRHASDKMAEKIKKIQRCGRSRTHMHMPRIFLQRAILRNVIVPLMLLTNFRFLGLIFHTIALTKLCRQSGEFLNG